MSDRRGRAAALAIGVAALGASAVAQTSPYYIGGYVGYTHLSNALGLADGAGVPPPYVSKSDNVTTVALVGGLDQRISRQRVFGDVTLRDNRYADNKLLSSKTYAASAGVDWETIERISGNLTLRSNRDLIRFGVNERPSNERNLVTASQADFSARIGVVTRWTFEAGAGWRGVDYTASEYASRELRQGHYSAGVRYWPSGTSSFGLTLRQSDGRYPRYSATTADRFDRRDIELSSSYRFSGLSSIAVRAAHSRIDYTLQNNLDFSGFTGSLRASYIPTGKLRFNLEIARDRGQDLRFIERGFNNEVVESFESAQLATALRLRASYDLSAKVALNASAGHTRRGVTLQVAGQEGRERTSTFALGATWTPTRTSRVGCDWSKESRRSDLLANVLNVSSSSFGCHGQLTLQP